MARMGTEMGQAGAPPRVDWVDYAKGFCIVMVVMMHSTLGVEASAGAQGWMHHAVEFAKPFRMPDFFLISGLFLARVIARDWLRYTDTKVLHFVYFYALWMTIQFAFKAPGMIGEYGAAGLLKFYLFSFVEPFGTLWFIWLLPVFFVITKLLRGVPALFVFAIAAALEIAPVETGYTMIDEFASRYVYFFAGYWLAQNWFSLAARVQDYPAFALAGLGLWAVVNGVMVFTSYAALPFFSLALGFAGAAAVATVAALLARVKWFELIRYAGENSIVIYLAFFLPMAVTRIVLLKTGIVTNIGTVSLIVTAAGVIVPLMFHWFVRDTRFGFLFVRPESFRIRKRPQLQPAE
jgi:uncharacterized membrane protein YcfT